MRKFSLLLGFVVSCSLIHFSCSKESNEVSPDVETPDFILEALGLSLDVSKDHPILIKSNESLNRPTGDVFLISGATFTDDLGKNMFVGDLKILGVDIPFNSSETRYLNRDLGIQLHELDAYTPGDDAMVELIAGEDGGPYASFEHVTTTSTAFNAEITLQPDPRRIDKNSALRIQFDQDPNFKDTYFILAQVDKPILIQVTQGNEFLIEESQLSFLDVGQAATYYLVRGELDCMMDNKAKVCIKKVLVATGGGLKVVDTGNK